MSEASPGERLADAALRGAVEDARALLAAGVPVTTRAARYPPEWSPLFDYRPAPLLHLATLQGHVELVRLLLAYGADVNERPALERSYQTHDDTYEVPGTSPLELAVERGLDVVADALLEAGAVDSRQRTLANTKSRLKGKKTGPSPKRRRSPAR